MKSFPHLCHLPIAAVLLALAGGLLPAYAAPEPPDAPVLARIDLDGASPADLPFPVHAHLQDAAGREYALVRADSAPLLQSPRPVRILAEAPAGSSFYLARSRRTSSRAGLPSSLRILHDDGHNLLLAPSTAADRDALSALGYELRRLPSAPMVFAAPHAIAAPRLASAVSNAYVAQMLAHVQATNLLSALRALTGETPVHAGGSYGPIATRNTYATNSLDRALDHATARLRAAGYEVTAQEWSDTDWYDQPIASRNLVAERAGTSAPDEIVILCAHIDSEPSGPLAPGADDNGSGSVAVLAAARAMRDFQFERTLRFVLFTGEEQGLLGSIAYANKVVADGDNVIGVVNLDMIAYDGNDDGHLNLNVRLPSNPGHADDMELVAAFTNAVALYGLSDRLVPIVYANGTGYSDHDPFWQVGYPAIHGIEDWENGDATPHYHKITDTIDTLNLPYFEAYAQASVATAAHLAIPVGPVTAAQRVSNAVHEVRIELEAALGNSVPTLGLVIQTPDAEYFASSAATPEQALASNTTFRFASNTKNFTATAVLLLQQMGLLDITNRIVDRIPGTDQPFIPEGANWAIPYKDLITIEQLLRHSAGVYDVDNDVVPGCGGESYTSWKSEQEPEHQFTVEEMVGQAALHQLSYFAPDEGYHYSNTGYAMLAEIVARVYSHYMGEPKTLSDFLYELNVVGPDIRFPNLATDTALPEPFLPGTIYVAGSDPIVISNYNMSAQVGEGNGYGTLPALNRHIRSTLKGEGVLNADMARLMRTNSSTHKADYAMGCTFAPEFGFGHNGARIGNLAFMGYRPDIDVSMAAFLPLWDYTDGSDSWTLCYLAMYEAASHALSALGYDVPTTLAQGTATNIALTATQTNTFYVTATHGVYYGVHVSGASADVLLSLAPGVDPASAVLFTNALGWTSPGTGTFRLDVSAPADTPATLRLYTLTNTIARVSALASNLMASNNLVGMGFSLVDGNHVVLQTGFGHADLERGIPADEDTVFMIGSCSKTFGAIAAMQLAEEGLLDLDAPFTNALPSFSIQQRFPDSVVTPRTILTHHSGLPGDLFNRGFSYVPSYDAPDFVQALLADETTLMPTNTFWAYNNSGFVLLGQAFRHLTGQPLDVFARTRLFDRMGMTNSSIIKDLPYIHERLARPYVDGKVFPDEYINLFFAGAIYSTPADMAHYLRMLLNGGMGDNARVVSNATLAAMAQKQNADIPLDQFNSSLNMGIGFVLDPPALDYMGNILWHDGGTVYFRTLLRAALDAQLGAFISCNSAEGAAPNYELVDSALQWAYEEKTGIAPPPPADPGSPAIVLAPHAVIALATNGPFVAGNGFYRFEAVGDGLLAHANAHTDDPTSIPLAYRENGWFTPTNSVAPQFLFTQTVGRVLCVYKSFTDGVTNTAILGEQSPGILGFDPAWSNRLGRWWTTNMHPDDISWLDDEIRLTVPSIELTAKDDILRLDCEVVYVLSATNDALAFAAGLGRNKGSVLRARPDGSLAFLGVHYRPENAIPVLAPGTATNGATAGDDIHWFRIPAPLGQPLTVDLDTTADLTAYLFSADDTSTLGQANRAHAFHLDATNAQPLFVAVVRNDENPGEWRLSVHTNAVPFYAQLAPADWPAQLIESAHRYPNADFGHVFVRENRDAPTTHILKIAVARMLSANPSARPLLFLNGGPGDSGIRCAYQYFLQGFSDTHHVYLIDPRGVNLSQPSLAFANDESPDEFQYRLRMLQQADLSAIRTVELAQDVNDVAAAFGIGIAEADLIGQSYGTYLAQALMRLDPPWLRSVVLDGVVAPNIPGLSQTGPIRHNALEAFFADVATNPLYPAFGDTLYALAESLQAHPVTLLMDGNSILVSGRSLLDAVLNQLTSTDLGTRERIPGIVWRVAHNETAALAELFEFRKDTNIVFDSVHDPVQQILIIKHDMLPFDSIQAAIEANAHLHPLLAALSIGFMAEAAMAAEMFDDYGQADPSITNVVQSLIPTLVINGTCDTQTGTNWAAEVASHLPNAHLVFVPGTGHGVLFATNGCTLQILRDFFANPAQPPDAACAQFLVPDFPAPWPADAPSLAPGATLSGSITNPGVANWYELAAPAPAVPVGGISDVHCQLRIVQLPDPFLVRIYGSTDGTPIAQHSGPGTLDFASDGSPLVLAIQPFSSGEQTGDYEIQFSIPFVVRKLAVAHPTVEIVWQGPPGAPVAIEYAAHLAPTNTFENVTGDLPTPTPLLEQTIFLPDNATGFFRILEQ